jgi:hypothetical protein
VTRSLTLLLRHGRDEIEMQVDDRRDGEITVASLSIPAGATVPSEDMVRLMEALIPWVRGGELGELPRSATVLAERG